MQAATWEAFGTTAVLKVTDPAGLARARAAVERELARIDAACSRFRGDSDLARVNARPAHAVPVDPLLVEALEVALRAAMLTGGDVDPTLGAALVLAGYDRDFSQLQRVPVRTGPARNAGPQAGTPGRAPARLRASWEAIELDASRGTVRVPPGVQLDLGATAKAWAADRVARAARAAAGCGALVSLGGDVATAGPAPARGWRVHVTEDHRAGPDAPGQTIVIRDGGLASSSTTVRRWRHRSATMHHILDPRSGLPAQGPWRTVTVAASTCTDANIAATAALVRGTNAGAWLHRLGLPARLVDTTGQTRIVGDWPR
jgi:thiamine biosynthesis lipoprotein ApbE